MTKVRVVHLLDDFAMGGVTNGLRVFDNPHLAKIAKTETVRINPQQWLAPKVLADIIVTHSPPRWKGMPFLVSLRWRNPKAQIIHVEHSYCRELETLHVRHQRRFHWLLKLAFRCADRVIAVSKAQAAWLIEIGAIAHNHIDVIYPYSRDQGLSAVPALKRKFDAPLIVGSYGRFCEAKGYERLIAAFKRLDAADTVQLVLGGMGERAAALKQLAKGCDRIHFVGKVEDAAAFMRSIDVFAVPSLYETFGQVASEAREAGRPLLVSTAGGLPEQVGKAGVIVNCDSEDELVCALRTLHTLPLEEMGRAGRADVQVCIQNRIAAWHAALCR